MKIFIFTVLFVIRETKIFDARISKTNHQEEEEAKLINGNFIGKFLKEIRLTVSLVRFWERNLLKTF